MRTLYLDIASHDGSVACVGPDGTACVQTVDHRVDDAGFVALMEDMLRQAGWTYADLQRIACAVGPGGFTSLRVGVSAANALAFTLGIPSCGIHLSDLYASRLVHPDAKPTWWMHSTKKKELFVRLLGTETDARCIPVEDLTALLAPGFWTGELLPEHRAVAEALGVRPAELRTLEETLPSFLDAQRYAGTPLQPWYGRGW